MSRRIARQMAMQSLFQMEFSDMPEETAFAAAKEQHEGKLSVNSVDYASMLVKGVIENKKEIDELIKKYVKDWDIARIPKADLSIFRIAIYEMYFSTEDIAPNIAINEAVEIAKIYGDDDSPRFINGVLGQMVKTIKKE